MTKFTKIDDCHEGGEGEVHNWYNQMQSEAITLISSKLRESYPKNTLAYQVHTLSNKNIILRFLEKEVNHYIYLIDINGNRTKLSQEEYEKYTSTKLYTK